MARDNENSYKQPDHLPATGLHPRRAMPDIDFEAERDDERAKRRVQMKLQRRAKDTEPDAGGRDGANTHENVSVDGAASDIGTPLPGELRERFETSLGADLSSVRVHTGAASATAADSVGAKAYTIGQDIHFGGGEYDPASKEGQHLLAHEVAHTVQQAGPDHVGPQFKLEISSPRDAAERQADQAADAMMAGARASVSREASGSAQLKRKDDLETAECNLCDEALAQSKAGAKAPNADIWGPSTAHRDRDASQPPYQQRRPPDEVETNWKAHVQTTAPSDPFVPRHIVPGASPPPPPTTKVVSSSTGAHHTTNQNDPFGLNRDTVTIDPFHLQLREKYWLAFRHAAQHVDHVQQAVAPDLNIFFHAKDNPDLEALDLNTGRDGNLIAVAEAKQTPTSGGVRIGGMFNGDNTLSATATDQRTINSAAKAYKEGEGNVEDAFLGTKSADSNLKAAISGVERAASDLEVASVGVHAAQKEIELAWREADQDALKGEIARIKQDATVIGDLLDYLAPTKIIKVARSIDFAASGIKKGEVETMAGGVANAIVHMISASRLQELEQKLADATTAVRDTRSQLLQAKLARAKQQLVSAVAELKRNKALLLAALTERRRAYNHAGKEAAAVASGTESSRDNVAGYISAIPIVENVLAAVRTIAERTRDHEPPYSRDAGIGYGMALHHANWEAQDFAIVLGQMRHCHTYFGFVTEAWEQRLAALVAVKQRIANKDASD